MKRQWLICTAIVGLALALTAGLSRAHSPEGPAEARLLNGFLPPGTAFTYQGRITKGGIPINGTCDFRFGLWDEHTDGLQIGITSTVTGVAVTDGLFTISDLDFGEGAFTGEARWLAVGVKCGSDPDYTYLTPRQALRPAPHALALPGLWTQQNGTSPNLIGGYSGNQVSDGVVGATIGGGGSSGFINRVSANYATVGGGYGNAASGPHATVGGGSSNTASGIDATVGGGYNNTASDWYATVSGGFSNTASGSYATVGGGSGNAASGGYATVGGGWDNIASGLYATVGGGAGNAASDRYATVGGGDNNTASDSYATVSGGYLNIASGPRATVGGGAGNAASSLYATVGGGEGNTASGDAATVGGGYGNEIATTASYASIPGGLQASASHYGQMAYASGEFATPGDAQTSLYVLRNTTNDTTQTELFLDGRGERITLPSGSTMVFDILIVARSSGQASAGYRITGVIENYNGTTSFIGTPTDNTLGEDRSAWSVSVEANDTYDALRILVTGENGFNIRWVAMVRTAEVSW
ncbi:MAG TPA: hypothetical protein EYH27_05945 [Anaerolineales bacterium]|nr:hypothetical protein [Anaerolineales bacterium]